MKVDKKRLEATIVTVHTAASSNYFTVNFVVCGVDGVVRQMISEQLRMASLKIQGEHPPMNQTPSEVAAAVGEERYIDKKDHATLRPITKWTNQRSHI